MDLITVVYTIRDREPDRLRQSVTSLKKYSSVPFQVMVVDYGSSDLAVVGEIKTICNDLSLSLIRCESQGLPWNRAHALNIGLDQVNTEFVVTTDIDIIFESDILKTSLNYIDEKVSIHCRPFWMPRSGNKKRSSLVDYSSLGGYQFIRREAYDQFGGLDERINFWGNEDLEWVLRLQKNGYRLKWIDSEARIYHVWHKPSYGLTDERPCSAITDTWSVMTENLLNDSVPRSNTGMNKSVSDRPILAYMEEQKPVNVTVGHYIKELLQLKEIVRDQKFVCLHLGDRFPGGRTTGWRYRWMHILQNLLFNRYGLHLKPKLNPNFDQWYVSLPYLKEIGLIDYYISEQKDTIWLLFE